YSLADICDKRMTLDQTQVSSAPLVSLAHEFRRSIGPEIYQPPETTPDNDPLTAFKFEYQQYYPQMIDWTANRIIELVEQGVKPCEIAVLAPYLSDSLRFGLTYRLTTAAIP